MAARARANQEVEFQFFPEHKMQQLPTQTSPRPKPEFFDAPCFSHRKRTPNRLPPKAPVKSCPPVSRIFSSPYNRSGARVVSFLSESHGENTTSSQISSPHYNPASRQPFFEQCFDVVSKLGEGSFGEVFKVKSKEDGKLYAIKRSRQRFRGDIDRWRKLHEVERHEKLSPHCNCIRFYKAWEERLHLYIMTELCLMSLAEYADLHGKLPEHRVWNVLLDLTQGLKHLHDNRLCHLDVKPANIFIGLDGFICKLGDFGLTVSIDSDLHDASEGDSRYIANELLKGRFSTAADVFSLGISLLELACDLELPSEGEGWHCLRNGHLPEQFITGLSSNLVHLLSSMMDPLPERRPTVNQLLTNTSLRRTALLRPLITTSQTTGSALKFIYSHLSHWICTLFSVFFIVLRISPWRHTIHSPSSSLSSSSDCAPAISPKRRNISNVSMETSNHYFSDSDEELEVLSKSFQNQSSQWINSSPISCTSPPVYNGSPIPLNFNDELRFSPTVRTSSPNNINIGRSEGRRQNMIKNINIGPRNLMDMFNETGD